MDCGSRCSVLLSVARSLVVFLQFQDSWRNKVYIYIVYFFLSWHDNPLVGLGFHPHSRGFFFLDHTHRHTTVGRTLLVEWSVRRWDLYLTKYTKLTTDRHPCPQWHSNPRSQQANGLRPTPYIYIQGIIRTAKFYLYQRMQLVFKLH